MNKTVSSGIGCIAVGVALGAIAYGIDRDEIFYRFFVIPSIGIAFGIAGVGLLAKGFIESWKKDPGHGL